MAVTNGNDYDHIDISKNGEVTRHHFKDASHFQATGRLVVGTGSATADYAVAVGHNTQANAPAAHAEGYMTKATGDRAHSEGVSTTASGWVSHAEGSGTIASGDSSHAENSHTIASGNASHAEGANTRSSGHYSHAEGYYTRATHKAQHVFGEFNVLDDSSSAASNRGNYVEIIGNGTDANARSNARTLDWSGNEELAGDLTVNKGGANEASVSAIAGDVSTLKNTSLTAQQKQMLVDLFSSTANTGHTTGDPVVAGRYLLECNVSTATGKASMFNFRWVLQE